MKIIIAPDSYKGCMSAVKVAEHMEDGVLKALVNPEILKIPVADGGEGTVAAMLTGAGGRYVYTKATGPLRNEIESFFGILADGKTAVIEMAAASGLELVPEPYQNPLNTTTFGTGELILAALDEGCTDIIIGVGGSATTDCGMGMAQALGVVFYDSDRIPLSYGGRFMNDVRYYDDSSLDPRLEKVNIKVACDVDNPLFGKRGAAYVYSAQKGASQRQIKHLDDGLRNIASVIRETSGLDINLIPGSGAAGGLAGGLVAFTGATLSKGIEIVTDACQFSEKVKDADLVITGEGRTDAQTSFGKVPVGIALIAKKSNVPVICISGSLGDGYEAVYEKGINAVFSITPGPITLNESIKNAGKNITDTTYNVIKTLLATQTLN
ncbi:MAG: glycerate kinase [Clostridiales bacterium]|nr:glycerate kinase [Clostridiales bacterium]